MRKKGLCAALSLTLVMAMVPAVPQTMWAGTLPVMPFELAAPKTVTLTKAYPEASPTDGDATTLDVVYSMESDMMEYLGKEYEEREAIDGEYGYGRIELVKAQVDWAVDDPKDWHSNEYWENDGYDADYNNHTGGWDMLEANAGPQATNDCWILRGLGDPESEDNRDWNGDEYYPGMKSLLKSGQYEIVTNEYGEKLVYVDWTKHTAYIRVRYAVMTRTDEADTWYVGPWSETASFGKDATQEAFDITKITAPEISDVTPAEEDFNGSSTFDYELTLPEELVHQKTLLEGEGGFLRLCAEACIKGVEKWTQVQGEGDVGIKSGKMNTTVAQLADPAYGAQDGENTILLRFRYYINYNGEESYSAYSDTFEVTGNIHLSDDPVPPAPGPEPQPEEPAAPGNDGDAVDDYITEQVDTDDDLKGTSFGILQARAEKVSKKSVTLQWTQPKGAVKYIVYGNKCGKENKYVRLEELDSTKSSFVFSQINGAQVKKNTYYKFIVVALDASNKVIGTSKTVHAVTPTKFTNPKAVKVDKAVQSGSATIAAGDILELKGKPVKANKKLKWKIHRNVAYESTDESVATVQENGIVTGVKKGTCTVYAYAQNGVFARIDITVE